MNTQNKLRNRLLAKYHILATQRNMTAEHSIAFLHGTYRVTSSAKLNIEQLKDACRLLAPTEQPKPEDPNMWRRRVMAAIGGWLKAVNREQNAEIIKAIACRASEYNSFNAIPISRLRDLYYEFTKKAKTTNQVKQLVSNEIEYLQQSN